MDTRSVELTGQTVQSTDRFASQFNSQSTIFQRRRPATAVFVVVIACGSIERHRRSRSLSRN